MAEVTVQSKLIRRLCDKAIEKENNIFEKLLPEMQEIENEFFEDYSKMPIFVTPYIPSLASQALGCHYKKITKLKSIRNLASLSEEITISESDIELLFAN